MRSSRYILNFASVYLLFHKTIYCFCNKNPKKAVELDHDICRNLGIGNSTGLGMAPFIVNHPALLNNWVLARETALKNIREIKKIKVDDVKIFKNCLKRSLKNVTSWSTDSEFQRKKIEVR